MVKMIALSLAGLLLQYCSNNLLPCQYLRLFITTLKNILRSLEIKPTCVLDVDLSTRIKPEQKLVCVSWIISRLDKLS
jgi:DNA polymerase III psi subunit